MVTQSGDCDPYSHDGSAGFGRSASTITVTVSASAVGDSPGSPSLPLSPISTSRSGLGVSTTTVASTTTATITIVGSVFPGVSNTSFSALGPSQSREGLPTSSGAFSFGKSSSALSASATYTESNSDRSTASGITPASPSSSSAIYCPTEPFNKTDMKPFFGFNVVNTKPSDPELASAGFRTKDDWQAAFDLLKQNFPHINAVRMYSTTDGDTPHLMNAIDAAVAKNLSILVGVWSGDINDSTRFHNEKRALEDVINKYGCNNFAAISVGNEDLNQINVLHPQVSEMDKDDLKNATANSLVARISDIRSMIRAADASCCNVPVTHTDTWNEFSDTGKAWIPRLMSAVDQATIINIFPYWSHALVTDSWKILAEQSNLTAAVTERFGKDVWLGETGWATSQPRIDMAFNEHGTNLDRAQQYFNQVGCQILSGIGTAFYYVD